MDKVQQTQEVKLRLYTLTQQFVYKYQPRYYKQFNPKTECLEDLASEFYLSFLTPKAREKGKEQSLLDKFDPSITTLEYLVKVSVQRKLIDYSRQHPYHSISIDEKTNEFGDCILKGLDLLQTQAESVDVREFSAKEISEIQRAFARLDDKTRASLANKFSELQNVVAPNFRKVFLEVFKDQVAKKSVVRQIVDYVVNVFDGMGESIECHMQQLTDKTAVILVDGILLNFDRQTGRCRNKREAFSLDLRSITEYGDSIIKPLFSREEFIQRYAE